MPLTIFSRRRARTVRENGTRQRYTKKIVTRSLGLIQIINFELKAYYSDLKNKL